MTPVEVMAEQVEPMLTLTTEDDINWMVVASNPMPNVTISSPKEPEIQKPSGIPNLFKYLVVEPFKCLASHEAL